MQTGTIVAVKPREDRTPIPDIKPITMKMGGAQKTWLEETAARLRTREGEIVRALVDAARDGRIELRLVKSDKDDKSDG